MEGFTTARDAYGGSDAYGEDDDEVVRNAPLWVKALAFLCASALAAAPVAALIWAFS